MEKAFDCVDALLLLYRLLSLGVGEKSIYSNCKAGVNVIEYITYFFSSVFVVR